MDELEAIKKKKLEQLQKQYQSQVEDQQNLQQQIQQLETLIKSMFTKEALQRYGNIKAADPEKAVQLLVIISQAMQGSPVRKIDDNQLKAILKRITPEKREMKIKFK